jgi:Carboxypeptidase regulatory-like domain
MTLLILMMALAASAFSASASSAQATPQAPIAMPSTPSPPPPLARVRGRVSDAATGKPLRHATLHIYSRTALVQRETETDDQGGYEVIKLPAGHYLLFATKEGYLGGGYGSAQPSQRGKGLDLHDGDAVDHVDVMLAHGAAISGRVVDEYGDPAPNIRVRALRGSARSSKGFAEDTSDMTDDLGQYRLYGLRPARYLVAASVPHSEGWDPDASNDDEAAVRADRRNSGEFAPTYYPGTPNVAEGVVVATTSGDAGGIDIKLVKTRSARITGLAFDSTGRPLKGEIETHPIGATIGTSTRVSVASNGRFAINGIPPGEYLLRATSSWGDGENASLRVVVAGRDVENLRIDTARAIHVSGRIVFDGAPTVSPSELHLMFSTMPVGGARWIIFGMRTATIHDDWTFTASAEPGFADVSLSALARGWALKAVRAGGVDVTETGIECKPRQDIQDVEIEITSHPPSVSGVVVNDRGEQLKDYVVIVFPQDEARWTTRSRYVQRASPDQDGRFTVTVPARNDYLVIALEDVDDEIWDDPEFLGKIRDRATPLALGDGESRTLSLTRSALQP